MLCSCGCGETIPEKDARGRPRRFVNGHGKRVPPYVPTPQEGFCECGCGQRTKISKVNCKPYGWVKGKPFRYIQGHTQRGRKWTMGQRLKQSVMLRRTGRRPPFNEAIRQKMSAAGKSRPKHMHPRWKGGVTPERQQTPLKKWADSVRERDGHVCQLCGETKRLHAHHIWSYAEFPAKRLDVDNGVTLCRSCHFRKPVHRVPRTLADVMFVDLAARAQARQRISEPEQPA